MARPTLMGHRKFRRFRRLLNVPSYACRGLLEMIWDSANECGEPVLGDALDVEDAAEWDGEEGVLASALAKSGLVDELDGGRFEIHHYWDHCPDYVRKRRMREMERQEKGKRLQSDRSVTGQSPVTDSRTADTDRRSAPNGRTPSPSPSPSPSHGKEEEADIPSDPSGAPRPRSGGRVADLSYAPELVRKIPNFQKLWEESIRKRRLVEKGISAEVIQDQIDELAKWATDYGVAAVLDEIRKVNMGGYQSICQKLPNGAKPPGPMVVPRSVYKDLTNRPVGGFPEDVQ